MLTNHRLHSTCKRRFSTPPIAGPPRPILRQQAEHANNFVSPSNFSVTFGGNGVREWDLERLTISLCQYTTTSNPEEFLKVSGQRGTSRKNQPNSAAKAILDLPEINSASMTGTEEHLLTQDRLIYFGDKPY
ncbi:hypothetical protein Droror1_Dr00023183 [Drosera rotundifolia]